MVNYTRMESIDPEKIRLHPGLAVAHKLFVLFLFRRRSMCMAKSHFSNITFAIELKPLWFTFSMNEKRQFK